MWQLGVVYTQQQEQRWSRMIKFSSGGTGDCLRWFEFTNQPLLYAVGCWDLEAIAYKSYISRSHSSLCNKPIGIQSWCMSQNSMKYQNDWNVAVCYLVSLGVNSNWVLSACVATVSIVKCCLILSVILSSRMQAALLQQQKGLGSNLLYLDV